MLLQSKFGFNLLDSEKTDPVCMYVSNDEYA